MKVTMFDLESVILSTKKSARTTALEKVERLSVTLVNTQDFSWCSAYIMEDEDDDDDDDDD